MKRLALLFLSITTLPCVSIFAAQGRITHLGKEVKLIRPQAVPRSAILNEVISNGTTIETGPASQAEIRFDNGSLVRLAAHTVCRVQDGTERIDLLRGAILLRAAQGRGEAHVTMGNVVSSLAGTTSILEVFPQAYTKLIAIDGTARMFMPSVVGESVLVNAGQLIMFHTKPAPASLPNPVDVDLQRLMSTSLLIKGFAPLGSETSIAAEMQSQKKQKSTGALADTNLVIFGRGTLVSLVPPDAAAAKKKPAPSPTPASNRTVR